MSPRLKYQRLTVKLSSTSRSRFRTESGLRRSASPRKKRTQNVPQTSGLLIFSPPKAPGPPRAIPHATCGPVKTSVTRPVSSAILACAIWPALPDHALNVQTPSLKVDSVTRPFVG